MPQAGAYPWLLRRWVMQASILLLMQASSQQVTSCLAIHHRCMQTAQVLLQCTLPVMRICMNLRECLHAGLPGAVCPTASQTGAPVPIVAPEMVQNSECIWPCRPAKTCLCSGTLRARSHVVSKCSDMCPCLPGYRTLCTKEGQQGHPLEALS